VWTHRYLSLGVETGKYTPEVCVVRRTQKRASLMSVPQPLQKRQRSQSGQVIASGFLSTKEQAKPKRVVAGATCYLHEEAGRAEDRVQHGEAG
jgi:hypothetical protein